MQLIQKQVVLPTMQNRNSEFFAPRVTGTAGKVSAETTGQPLPKLKLTYSTGSALD